MSDRSILDSTNPLSKPQLPSFVEMLDVSQKNLIKNLWKTDDLSISDKIDSIDSISKDMPKEARVEYRKWRFQMDRSRMPDFYDSQNKEIKMIIAATFEKSTDLEEFTRVIMSIKSSLNNPDAFDKWMKNEEIEFKEPSTQKDTNKESTSLSSFHAAMLSSLANIGKVGGKGAHSRGGGLSGYHIENSLFDPGYSCDFINVKDTGKTFTRGGREYFRPIGSRRFAIKVLGKYKDDKWMGSSGDASTGEWPVAYHGTQESNALDIVKQGFDINKCRRFAYGEGIFCAPDPRTAFAYGSDYNYEGKPYRLILQVRVDPSKIEVVKKKDSQMGEYWIVPNGDSIRPYGICCFPVN